MSLGKADIRTHYKRSEVANTIIRLSSDGGYCRAGMKFTPNAYVDRKTGEIKDSMDWYNSRVGHRTQKRKINLAYPSHYYNAVTECRTLYWTLNLFERSIFQIDFKGVERIKGPGISRDHTAGYMLGIDIDKEHASDIHDPKVKSAVEAMAQYFVDVLRVYLPNSVYVLFSGGGIYVMVHHRAMSQYFSYYGASDEWDVYLLTLLDAFDSWIRDVRDSFFEEHPQYKGLVKPDQLNGSQRVFKTIFSIHKLLDYAVIPLNPNNVKIDFEKAKIPLKNSVFDDASQFYKRWDVGIPFIKNVLNPYLHTAYAARKNVFTYTNNYDGGDNAVIISKDQLHYDDWAPCMKNLFDLPSCGEGATRALAVFVSYLGQIGTPEDEAFILFTTLAGKWNARTSNIFESYFRMMKTPTCERLNSPDNIGFPKGVSIRRLNVCQPDKRCRCVPSPFYYTDTKANEQRKSENTSNQREYVPVINRKKVKGD